MKVAPGTVVTLEYTVRFGDGRLLDSTASCGPVMVMIGSGQLFPALEDRILGLEAGETHDLLIPAEDAYGPWHSDLVRTLPRDRLPADLEIEVGRTYAVELPEGRKVRFRVLDVDDAAIRADFNEPHAGEALHAIVTIVAVRRPTAEEERRGRAG